MGVGLKGLLGISLAAAIAAPSAGAQGSTEYLFHRPYGSVGFRVGYLAANTSGDLFSGMRRDMTLGSRSFDAANLGADFGINLTRRFELGFSIEGSRRAKESEYREWEETPPGQTQPQPIRHTSTLARIGLSGNVRYNFADRGRQISSLSWIPSKTVPYAGIGAGYTSYELVEKGDFVESTDGQTARIFADELRSDGHGTMMQAFTGVDYSLDARWVVFGETRYTHASSKLKDDYSLLGNIDLSGLALNIGARVRF